MKRERYCSVFWAGLLILALSSPSFAEETKEETVTVTKEDMKEIQEGLQSVFGDLFSAMGGIVTGMTQGMQEGAKDMQSQLDSAGGAEVIADKEKLLALTETMVLKAEQLTDNSWRIVLAVKNTQDFPVRLANLTAKQQVLLQDKDDFVYEQKETDQRIVTVPERAALKVEFFFPNLDGSTPKILRLYGQDFPVSHVTKSDSETSKDVSL